jgi:hypothetical protein
MKKTLFTLLTSTAMLAVLTLSGCDKDPGKKGDETGGVITPAKNTVTGVVKDAKGNPIAGAKVRVENDFSYYDVTTNAQGQYSCKVASFGSYKVLAWAPVTYQGINYMLRAGMAKDTDYDFVDVSNGAVRNFQLQHKGRIPDRTAGENGTGYFGASINFYKLGSLYGPQLEAGDVVTYYLTPIGDLMDGTTGQVLQGSFIISFTKTEYYVVDVPAGKYKVEAIVTRDGANYRVYVGSFSSQSEAMEIVPRADDYGVGNYENGFMHPANVVYMTVR